jgi:hypothetical protein
MIRCEIVRLSESDLATKGALLVDGDLIAAVLELPWRDNQRNISRIPEGVYLMERYISPKHGYEVFKLRDVPGRDDIEIHIGNYIRDTLGCPLVGNGWTVLNGLPALTQSAKTYQTFMAKLKGADVAEISIYSVFRCSGGGVQ